MIAAQMLGLGAGTAWFSEPDREAIAKELLGVPTEDTLRSIMVVGPYVTAKDPRPTGPKAGRKPLEEIVSYEKFGQR
jgi:nitroreductase